MYSLGRPFPRENTVGITHGQSDDTACDMNNTKLTNLLLLYARIALEHDKNRQDSSCMIFGRRCVFSNYTEMPTANQAYSILCTGQAKWITTLKGV